MVMTGVTPVLFYDPLERVVATLDRFLQEPVETERDRAGVIQAFEFCYELSWKSLQEIATSEGLAEV